jgi:hypothetical protein
VGSRAAYLWRGKSSADLSRGSYSSGHGPTRPHVGGHRSPLPTSGDWVLVAPHQWGVGARRSPPVGTGCSSLPTSGDWALAAPHQWGLGARRSPPVGSGRSPGSPLPTGWKYETRVEDFTRDAPGRHRAGRHTARGGGVLTGRAARASGACSPCPGRTSRCAPRCALRALRVGAGNPGAEARRHRGSTSREVPRVPQVAPRYCSRYLGLSRRWPSSGRASGSGGRPGLQNR